MTKYWMLHTITNEEEIDVQLLGTLIPQKLAVYIKDPIIAHLSKFYLAALITFSYPKL